jgi:hypothetical protein
VSDAFQFSSLPGHVAFEEQPHPGLDDVMQRPAEPIAVPVVHEGPITTHELPSKLGTTFALIASANPQVALAHDRMRKRAVLISTDNPFLISVARSINGTGVAATWPANVPFIYTAESELTVATASGTAAVSVVTENYAR